MALLKEKNVSVRELWELSLKAMRNDEESCILLDEVMQLCKENDIAEEPYKAQRTLMPVKENDLQRDLQAQVNRQHGIVASQ